MTAGGAVTLATSRAEEDVVFDLLGEKRLKAEDRKYGPPAAPEPGADELCATDLANGCRLAARHGANLLYAHGLGWLVWDGARWRGDQTGHVERLAKETAVAILDEAKSAAGGAFKRLAKWAVRSCDAARIRAMISLAASEPEIALTAEQLDRAPLLFNVANGTLDLRSGELRSPARADLLTKTSPVAYDAAASCPTWDAFLARVLNENKALIDFLRRLAGYALTGLTTEQVLPFLHGRGANGKTTFVNALLRVLGDYGCSAAPDLLVAQRGERHPTERADLRGRRLVVAAEIDDGRRLAEGLVKTLTGGDRLKARYMRRDFFEFEPTAKIWLVANHKPTIRGTDHAIWRRIKLIPFTVTIPDHEQDRALPEKLRAEAPGILAWAVRGCLQWQQQGLGAPEEVCAATATYRAEQDVLGGFLGECCELSAGANEPAARLYKAYTGWCAASGEKPESQKAFGQHLAERDFEPCRGSGGTRIWKGLRLQPSALPDESPQGVEWRT